MMSETTRSNKMKVTTCFDESNIPQGDVSSMGMLTIEETGEVNRRAIVVTFDNDDDLNAAISQRQCRFTVFGGEA